MSTAQVFSVSELVWGKVEPYPWWPGRVSVHLCRLCKSCARTISRSTKSPSSQKPPSTLPSYLVPTYCRINLSPISPSIQLLTASTQRIACRRRQCRWPKTTSIRSNSPPVPNPTRGRCNRTANKLQCHSRNTV